MSERAPSSGRRVAARVLHRVATDGAWASPTLDAELSRASLPASEAGRASDLVYGTLRALPAVDRVIAERAKRGQTIEPLAHAAMRVAVFELLYTGAASHAIVDEAVGLVKRERSIGLSRFVNAVLRAVSGARGDTPRARSLELPAWVKAELDRSLGAERSAASLAAGGEVPFLGLRTYGTSVEALRDEIARARPEAELSPSSMVTRALGVRRTGDLRTLTAYRDGRFAVQDVGSQRLAELVGAQPGETVLDACAGRGGKTAVLADAVGERGRVVAVDLHERKIESIAGELRRLGLRAALETHVLDLSVGRGKLAERSFDRVLVDAPCTGLGTLRRRPEILLRLSEPDVARMAALELAIVANVVPLVGSGGLLAVATCSFATAEGAGLAATIEQAFPSLRRVVDADTDPDGVTRIGPWLDRGSDAYQLVRFLCP